MPKAGYHPVCVLYQGNDSPYDGTYQLICHHQIKDKDFQPGDVVEVLPDPFQEDSDGESPKTREAIALGDEMIVGLLGNFCSSFTKPKRSLTQSTGCSSSNSEDSPPVKKSAGCTSSNSEDMPPVKKAKLQPSVNQVKAEASSGQQSSDSRMQADAMREMISVMNSIRSQNHSILNEIRILKQQHVSFQQELIIIKELVNNSANNKRPPLPPAPVDYLDMEDVPSQVGLHPPAVPSPNQSIDNSSQGAGMDDGTDDDKEECSQYPTSPITVNPPMQDSFDSSKSDSFSSTANTSSSSFAYHPYPYYSNLNKHYNYHFVDDNHSNVFVGGPDFGVQIPKIELDQMILKTATPTSFSYRLASKLFTTEEMLKGNTSGIGIAKTGIHFHKLNNNTLSAILAEVENRFPGARTTHEGDRRLLSAINDCCRNRRKRTLYNKMKVVGEFPGQPNQPVKGDMFQEQVDDACK